MANAKHADATLTPIVNHPVEGSIWPPDRNGADHLPTRRMQGRPGYGTHQTAIRQLALLWQDLLRGLPFSILVLACFRGNGRPGLGLPL